MDWPKCEYITQRARVRAEFATGQNSDYAFEHVVCTNGDLIGELTKENYGSCPWCNGTGERDLTVDEAVGFISKTFEGVKYPNTIAGYNYAFELIVEAYLKTAAGECESFTAALNDEVRKLRRKG